MWNASSSRSRRTSRTPPAGGWTGSPGSWTAESATPRAPPWISRPLATRSRTASRRSREDLLAHAYDYVGNLVRTVSPASLKATRRQIYADLHRDVAAAVEESESLVEGMMRDADFEEGVTAFNEKRDPRWRGP